MAAGPNSASSGWAAITMNRAGRHACGSRLLSRARRLRGHRAPGAPADAGRRFGGSRFIHGRLYTVCVFSPARATMRSLRRRSSPPTSEASFRVRRRAARPAWPAGPHPASHPRHAVPLRRGQGRRDVLGMALRLDLVPGVRHAAVGPDEERRALDAHVRPAVLDPLDPGAVGIGRGVVLVGKQGEVEVELLPEAPVARGVVGADPPDRRARGHAGRRWRRGRRRPPRCSRTCRPPGRSRRSSSGRAGRRDGGSRRARRGGRSRGPDRRLRASST